MFEPHATSNISYNTDYAVSTNLVNLSVMYIEVQKQYVKNHNNIVYLFLTYADPNYLSFDSKSSI